MDWTVEILLFSRFCVNFHILLQIFITVEVKNFGYLKDFFFHENNKIQNFDYFEKNVCGCDPFIKIHLVTP